MVAQIQVFLLLTHFASKVFSVDQPFKGDVQSITIALRAHEAIYHLCRPHKAGGGMFQRL